MFLLDLKRKVGALNSMGALMKKGGKGAFILKKKNCIFINTILILFPYGLALKKYAES